MLFRQLWHMVKMEVSNNGLRKDSFIKEREVGKEPIRTPVFYI